MYRCVFSLILTLKKSECGAVNPVQQPASGFHGVVYIYCLPVDTLCPQITNKLSASLSCALSLK